MLKKKDNAWLIAKTLVLIPSVVHHSVMWVMTEKAGWVNVHLSTTLLLVDHLGLARWQLQAVSVILVIAASVYKVAGGQSI